MYRKLLKNGCCHPEKERDEFFVDANLIDDAIEDDAMVPLFQNFNLTIANVIVNGNINIAARYGVFGERIKGNITGLNCVTTIGADKTKTRLKGIKEPTYNYGFLAGFGTPKFEVKVDPTMKDIDVAFSAKAVIRAGRMEWMPNEELVKKESLNTAECGFHHKNYSMAHLYDDFSSKMCAKWDSYFFGAKAQSNLDKIQLPILGKSILEIMGLRNKFEELNNYFERIQSGSNIQEILDYIKKEIGMEVTASYEYSTRNNVKDTILHLTFKWTKGISNYLLELDSLNLGRTVSSRATLSFQLLVPFVESEKAKSTSELDKLGLGQYDEQLGSIIGANAIVAEKMDHYYGGWSDLSTYANYVKGQCGNRFTSCVNADTCSYVLYSASSSAVQLDLSKYPEFDGVTPNYGFVIKWNANADKAKIDYKYLDQKTKNFVANDIEGLASLLTSVLGRSKNDDVLRLVARKRIRKPQVLRIPLTTKKNLPRARMYHPVVRAMPITLASVFRWIRWILFLLIR